MAHQFQPPPAPALPLEQREYHSFWRTARWSWWRPVVALFAFGVAFFGFSLVAVVAALVIDSSTGRTNLDDLAGQGSDGNLDVTPAFFLANNLALAALIPSALLLAWALFGQRPRWLTSVVGGIRWRWLARCVMVLLPLWLLYVGVPYLIAWQFDEDLSLSVNPETWVLLIGILITTPLQAAGEEYGFRGFIQRSVSSYFRNSRIGLAVGALIASTLFMLAHGAGDLWLNIFYFCFALVATWMTWRTGGLEAAIVMHAANNVLSEALLPFQDISGIFDRQAGAGDWTVLFGVGVCVVGALLVEWQARGANVVRRNDPGVRTEEGQWFLAARAYPPSPPVGPAPVGPAPVGPAPVGPAQVKQWGPPDWDQQSHAGGVDPYRSDQGPAPRPWDDRQV